jgi:hypothetical protein
MMLASTAAGNPVVDEYLNGSGPVPQLTSLAGEGPLVRSVTA